MHHAEFINTLVNKGWIVERNDAGVDHSKIDLGERIDKTSGEFKSFISSFSLLSAREDDRWFLSLRDYLKSDNAEGFVWNEFEVQSLEAAEGEDEISEIMAFWNKHLPFMLSVKNSYAYFAIILDGPDKGKIVMGSEPMYEQVSVVAANLPSFFQWFINAESSPESQTDF